MIQQNPSQSTANRKSARFQRWIDALPEILATASPAEVARTRAILDGYQKTPATVLVLNYSDGNQVVHGDTHIQAMILNVPGPLVSTPERELKLEQLIELLLGKKRQFKNVFWPAANVRTTGQIKRVTAGDIGQRVAELELLYSIGETENPRYQSLESKQLAALEA